MLDRSRITGAVVAVACLVAATTGQASAVTPPPGCGVPVGVSGVDTGSGTALVAWTPGGTGCTAYAVWAFTYAPGVSGQMGVTADQGELTMTGLVPGDQYTFTAIGYSGSAWVGWSAYSPWVHLQPVGAPPYGDPNLVSLFDGSTLNGWYYQDQGTTWSVADGAIHGHGPNLGQIITAQDYGSFRLIVTSRMVPPVPGACCAAHLGVLVWGNRPPAPNSLGTPFLSSLEFQPPNGSMWDRQLNRDTAGVRVGPKPIHPYTDWSVTELVFDVKAGTVRWASDGVEILRYTDPNPSRWKAGPIGLELNYPMATVEYKDIYVEPNPPNTLITTQ